MDRAKMEQRPTPDSFKSRVKDPNIDVLPLSKGGAGSMPGWCVYANTIESQPDIEILCGGVNSKEETAAAIFRQGNLLHFGFDLSPGEMNDQARALLVNSIAYIARFTEERALIRIPNPIRMPRATMRSWLDRGKGQLEYFKQWLDPSVHATAGAKTAEEYKQWFDLHWGELTPGAKGLLLDEEIRALKTRNDSPEFFEAVLKALSSEPQVKMAKTLLIRYVPEGPGENAGVDEWKKWIEDNRPYLFFSDWGGYRWYVDPLAKKRGVETIKLRGPSRADQKKQ